MIENILRLKLPIFRWTWWMLTQQPEPYEQSKNNEM